MKTWSYDIAWKSLRQWPLISGMFQACAGFNTLVRHPPLNQEGVEPKPILPAFDQLRRYAFMTVRHTYCQNGRYGL